MTGTFVRISVLKGLGVLTHVADSWFGDILNVTEEYTEYMNEHGYRALLLRDHGTDDVTFYELYDNGTVIGYVEVCVKIGA